MAMLSNMKLFVIVFFTLLLIGQYTMLKFVHHNNHEDNSNNSFNMKNSLSRNMNKFKASVQLAKQHQHDSKHHISKVNSESNNLEISNKHHHLSNFHLNVNHLKGKEISSSSVLLKKKKKSFYHRQQEHNIKHNEQKKGGRIAIVIPYIGSELPSWFPIFAASCKKSISIADWLIFTAGNTRIPTSKHDINHWLPINIKFIELGISKLSQLHARLVDIEDREEATVLFEESLNNKPYGLVEFKPAIGHIFYEYLLNYSFWCFSDLDLIMGDLPNWTDELLLFNLNLKSLKSSSNMNKQLTFNNESLQPDWDLFTYSFGDQFRMYTRGQFTVHRNIDKVC